MVRLSELALVLTSPGVFILPPLRMDVALQAYVDGTYASVPPSVCEDVDKGKHSLLELIKNLGTYLTSDNEVVRARAIALLSCVIEHLASQRADHTHVQLRRQTIRTLTEFFSSKISDAVIVGDIVSQRANDAPVVPATAPRAAIKAEEDRTLRADQMLYDCLRTLLVLSSVGFEENEARSRDAFGGEDARTAAKALFSLDLRKYPQPLRFVVGQLLDALVTRHLTALASMRTGPDAPDGSAFVHGYATLVTGEKDPRNLLLLFGLARVLLLEWDMGPKEADAMYNILFCYFPISFRPPPDDPYGITPDQLKKALRACLSASSKFAPMAYPLLLEKLSATGGSSKIDTLQTISACLPVYGRAAAIEHGSDLWTYLQLDILQPTDEQIIPFAQDTLTAFLRVICTDQWEPLAQSILQTCLDLCQSTSQSQARDSMRVLQCFVNACHVTYTQATNQFMRVMLRQWQDVSSDVAHQRTELRSMYLNLLITAQDSYEKHGRPLDAFHEQLVYIYTSPSLCEREHGLRGLQCLFQLPGLLTPDDRLRATRCLQNVLLEAPKALQPHALKGLEIVLDMDRSLIQSETVPFLLSRLPTHVQRPPLHVPPILSAVSCLCTTSELFDAWQARAMSLLKTLSTSADDLAHVGYMCALLATLQVTIERKMEAKHEDLPLLAQGLTIRLLDWLHDPNGIATHQRLVVQQASDLLLVLVPHIPATNVTELVGRASRDIRVGHTEPDAFSHVHDRLLPCAAIITGLSRQAKLPQASEWLRTVVSWIQHSAMEDWYAKSACFLLCALANKFAEPEPEYLATFWATVATIEARPRHRLLCLEAWLWLARGWMARGVAFGIDMVHTLLTDMLRDKRLGVSAARALHVLADHDHLLTRSRGFQVRILYKQRILDSLLQSLMKTYREHRDETQRAPCLVAIATILPALTEASLYMYVETLLPILSHALCLSDARVRTSCASFVTNVAQRLANASDASTTATATTQEHDADRALRNALIEHLPVLVPRLLANAEPGADHSISVRLASLQALHALVDALPHDCLFIYRRQVVQTLGRHDKGVDDKVRSVRAAAVDCRSAWYRVQALE